MLSRQILRMANQGGSRIEFLSEVSRLLLDFSRCDALEIWLSDHELHYIWHCARRPAAASQFQVVPAGVFRDQLPPEAYGVAARLHRVCQAVLADRSPRGGDGYTAAGSFWSADTATLADEAAGGVADATRAAYPYRSIAVIRFVVDENCCGLLQLKHTCAHRFARKRVELYEAMAQTLGLAVADRRAQHARRERVKELTCLYGIARVVEQDGLPLDAQLRQIVELLPPAWQFPDIAGASIAVDAQTYSTAQYGPSAHAQREELSIGGRVRGFVELVYRGEKPEFAEGAFLREERSLIQSVAQAIEQLVERHEARQERERLFEQLRHADRLATIGQLAAGVGHELNEPLGNVLGFAQLLRKSPELPESANVDLQKIIDAALHAREVIRKLLLFSRQTPPRRTAVDLNALVRDGLYFLESRCAKHDIRLIRELAPDLPTIVADPGQMQQVLVNLIVNAIQAMPGGGRLTVRTVADSDHVTLTVEDTGHGMSAEVARHVFDPFFTTKDVGEGTGLGLSVVHGIVTSHGGSIRVESAPGCGARFYVRLPRNGADGPPGTTAHE
ncbi:MAG: hypothetical protein HRF50_16855 [Phycisphaerae bacterium]